MCDTLCILGPEGTLFAKSSDRPPAEVQLVEAHEAHPAGGGALRTQYLDIEDEGACAVLIARPDWLWGAEHGINTHGVAIGNEKVDTVADPNQAPAALIGMDLVRLGLERATTAEQTLDVITGLLEKHGQGGLCDQILGQSYWSSFLIADRSSAWVLETSGSSWVATPASNAAAISNRISIRGDWTRSSSDISAGTDFDRYRDPKVDSGFADRRLAASTAFVSGASVARTTPAGAVAHLRDHGSGPWGEPGRSGDPKLPPTEVLADGTGVTVCMHVHDLFATTSSMVAMLPSDPGIPPRAWVAIGSPCVSVYVPTFGIDCVPRELSDPDLWQMGATLRERVEERGEDLMEIRSVLDPIEAELWAGAEDIAQEPGTWKAFTMDAGTRVRAAMEKLSCR